MSNTASDLLPAIDPKVCGCLNCGVAANKFHPESLIAVGFGSACVSKDGIAVYQETVDGPIMTGSEAEAIAKDDPDHDWRIELHGPLSGRVYQRHGPGIWVLVEQDNGFA